MKKILSFILFLLFIIGIPMVTVCDKKSSRLEKRTIYKMLLAPSIMIVKEKKIFELVKEMQERQISQAECDQLLQQYEGMVASSTEMNELCNLAMAYYDMDMIRYTLRQFFIKQKYIPGLLVILDVDRTRNGFDRYAAATTLFDLPLKEDHLKVLRYLAMPGCPEGTRHAAVQVLGKHQDILGIRIGLKDDIEYIREVAARALSCVEKYEELGKICLAIHFVYGTFASKVIALEQLLGRCAKRVYIDKEERDLINATLMGALKPHQNREQGEQLQTIINSIVRIIGSSIPGGLNLWNRNGIKYNFEPAHFLPIEDFMRNASWVASSV